MSHACSKLADLAKKKIKRKKKSCRTSLSGDGIPHSVAGTSALDDIDIDLPVTPKSGLDSDLSDADLAPDHSANQDPTSLDGPASTHARSTVTGEDSSEPSTAPGSSRELATVHHSRTSSATADLESLSSAADIGIESAGQEAVRTALEAAVTQANSAIEVGVAAGDDVLQRVLDELDMAIQNAVEESISAKYSKKVRKRLQQLLHEAINNAASGDEEAAAAATAAHAPAPKQEWQTAGAKAHRPLSSKGEAAVVTPNHAGRHHVFMGGQSPQQRMHHRQGQGQGQGQPGPALAQLLTASGVIAPPPPPPPRQPPPPPPSQGVQQAQQSKAEQASGFSVQSSLGPGHGRTTSGNAWGVPAKHRINTQVSADASQPHQLPFFCTQL